MFQTVADPGVWARKRCYLTAVTAGLWSLVPNFLPSVLPFMKRPSAVVQLLIDDERGVMYARGKDSRIRVSPPIPSIFLPCIIVFISLANV